MAAVRDLLSSLNSLAQSGLLAGGWLRLGDNDGAEAPTHAGASASFPEPREDAYTEGGVEPPLDELLDDPVIHLMMRADRLEPEQVRRLLTSRQWQAEP
jgi:hypothetical protein